MLTIKFSGFEKIEKSINDFVNKRIKEIKEEKRKELLKEDKLKPGSPFRPVSMKDLSKQHSMIEMLNPHRMKDLLQPRSMIELLTRPRSFTPFLQAKKRL